MASSTVRFTCTAVPLNKKGILTPDEKGYYTHPLGALNVFNSMGEYYTYEGARELFESSSSFMRKVTLGQLYGENGHPEWPKGMSENDFLRRYLKIEESRTCAHFSEIWIDFDGVKDEVGNPIIAIMGKVTPSGELAYVLDNDIKNPNINTCFSIRAFTDDKAVGGITHRRLTSVVTFDKVPSPGIRSAQKFASPALESFSEKVNKSSFMPLISRQPQLSGQHVMSTEADRSFALEVFQQLGFNVDHGDLPTWAKQQW